MNYCQCILTQLINSDQISQMFQNMVCKSLRQYAEETLELKIEKCQECSVSLLYMQQGMPMHWLQRLATSQVQYSALDSIADVLYFSTANITPIMSIVNVNNKFI